MRAKFYTVSQHENGGRLSLYLEQSLSQIAVAFGHSFLIRNEAMEEAAQHLGEDETAISILAESASFAPLAQQAGAFALERAFFHNFRSSLLKRDGSPQGTIVAPVDGSDKNEAAVRAHLNRIGKNDYIDIKKTPALIETLINSPENMGMVACSYDAGRILKSLATKLYGLTPYYYETMLGKGFAINAAPVEKEQKADGMSPFGMYFAAARTLLHVMKLEQEGNCLKTSIINILYAVSRT